jgi:hypothetical protein
MSTTRIQRGALAAGTIVALLTTEVSPAHAEERDLALPRPNQGLFMSVALLSASAFGFDSERANRALTTGFATNIRLGGSVTDWLDLGVGFAYGETFGSEDHSVAFGRVSLHSQWYLNPRWFARLEVGAGSVAGQDPSDPSYDRGGYGEVYSAGIGHNLYLSPATQSGGWVLSPVLGADVTPSDGLTAVVAWIGLEVSTWGGLGKDKLRLPFERAYV